ncbi:MAG: hypothetical protein ABIN67_15290 [Ferruginibacter sp.]
MRRLHKIPLFDMDRTLQRLLNGILWRAEDSRKTLSVRTGTSIIDVRNASGRHVANKILVQ